MTPPFEHRAEPLVSRSKFYRRLGASVTTGLLLIAGSLSIGMLGYHFLEGQPWIDAFDSAAMLLSGMGPLVPLHTFGGKLFAGLYALYCGLAVIVIASVIFAPVIHRFLHHFHLEAEQERSHSRSKARERERSSD